MTSPHRRARRMAPAQRRAAIIEAARPLVLRHGAAVTTRQIAEAGGIAEGTIFRVFPDKESVVQAVAAEVFDPEPTLRALAAVDRSLPLRARLVAATAVLQERLVEVVGLLEVLGSFQPPDPEEREQGPPAHAAGNTALLAAITDIVRPDEHLLRVPAPELAHAVWLLGFSGSHPKIACGRLLTPEQIVAVVLDGLATPTTEDTPC